MSQVNCRRCYYLSCMLCRKCIEKIWYEALKKFKSYTSSPVRLLNTRSLSTPQDKHSGFLLPSLSVKKISGFSWPISRTHLGSGIFTSSPTFPPHSWNDITTWRKKLWHFFTTFQNYFYYKSASYFTSISRDRYYL